MPWGEGGRCVHTLPLVSPLVPFLSRQFMRRHHCRRCGRVVCANCSPHLDTVKSYDQPVRVCDTCHALSNASEGETSETTAPDGNEGGMATNQDHNHPTQYLNPTYKLIPNDHLHNGSVRVEFYYERTPNTALCLSLADLMISKRQAAGLVLDCCHTVSAQLVPDLQGRVNEELDHHFVIG